MAPHVIDNRSVDIRTSDPVGTRTNNLAACNDRDVRRPAADIDDGGSVRVVRTDAATESRRQSFFDHADPTNARVLRRGEQRASLNRRDIREDTHQRTTTEAREAAAGLAHEVSEHLLRSFEIRDDAVKHRRDHGDATRLASVLLSRFATDVNHLARRGLDGNERRLVNHHAAPAHGNDRRRRSHVYRHESHARIKAQKKYRSYMSYRTYLFCGLTYSNYGAGRRSDRLASRARRESNKLATPRVQAGSRSSRTSADRSASLQTTCFR